MVDGNSDSFAVIARDKDVIRLGHETLQSHQLSRAAIDSAISCLKRFRSIAEARGAEQIVVVATASIREANNSRQFIAEVKQATNLRVEILSGIEEARLIGLAAFQGSSSDGGANLNLDIGGGSTEISLFGNCLPVSLYSVKLGAVLCTEKYLSTDPPKLKELTNLRNEIRAAFERPARELKGQKWQQVTGTSGTILAIGATLRQQLTTEEVRKNQAAQPIETEIGLKELSRLNVSLGNMSEAERSSVPGISTQRSGIIIAGGQILEGAMRALRIDQLMTCDWALREGVIIDRFRELEAESRPPTTDYADPKLRGVHAVGRRFGYEESHSHQVARLAEKLFDGLSDSEGLTRHQRSLLSAASLLHDVGYHIAHDSHHKHSLYLIRNSELTGFSQAEREVIANIARYHRRSLPKDKHLEFASLNPADRETVMKLGGILRVADALDRSHDSRVSDLRLIDNGEELRIEITSSVNCDNELLQADRNRQMFEQAFGYKLEVTLSNSKKQ